MTTTPASYDQTNTANSPAITVRELSKSFGANKALANVSFSVPKNSVYGLLGPNGAGKTTLIKILLGLSRPDNGQISILGGTPTNPATRTKIGYVPDVPEFDGWMTAAQYLESLGRLLGFTVASARARSDLVLKRVGLAGVTTPIGGFSRGMRQRLGIAQGLLGGPEVLILDEPTTALDPAGRAELLDLIQEVSQHCTIIFSTHLLTDVDRVCDHVLVLNSTVVTASSIADLRATLKPEIEVEIVDPNPDARAYPESFSASEAIANFSRALESEPWLENMTCNGLRFTISLNNPDLAARRIPELAVAYSLGIRSLTPVRHSMESIFFQLLNTGGKHA
ncbi:MAG: ABC transporter ATP-binding protein [Arcanobacterium sp.]